MDYSRFISKTAFSRKPTPQSIKDVAASYDDDLPLPFDDLEVEVEGGTTLHFKGERLRQLLSATPSAGHPELLSHLRALTERVHHPPNFEESRILVTVGGLDATAKVVDMVLAEGGGIVCERHVFSAIVSMMRPYKPEFTLVDSDARGMRPESLEQELEKLGTPEDFRTKKGMPKMLYINPTGGNPTGTVISQERREEVYRICRKYDLMILEDDPYFFVRYGDSPLSSFLALDVDGRVVRVDSFSKTVGAGLRLGYATGPKDIMDKVELHLQVSPIHVCTLVQMMVSELFNEWGIDGYLQHVKKLEAFYREKRDAMAKSAEKHLGDLCEWDVPEGGMFFWIKVKGVVDTWDMIINRALEKNVMLMPGRAFSPIDSPSPFLRASFSMVSEEDVDIAFGRLAELIREELDKGGE